MPKAKGNTTQRGYGTEHQALRRSLKPIVEAGQATCWRCQRRIGPGEPWDLGHDDEDRTRYRGPEHVGCNRRTATRRMNKRQSRSNKHSRDWLK